MYNPFQQLIDWLSAQFDAMMSSLNPINLILATAAYFASLLPPPDPAVADIVNQAVAALDTVVKFIALSDYVINLPVLLAVVGIIFVAETAFNIFRAWRIIRSTLT